MFLVVSCQSPPTKMGTEVSALSAQGATLYNSQLYFRPRPQLLDVPTEIQEEASKAPEPSSASEPPNIPEGSIKEGRANAVMLMLARNNELEGAVNSVRQLEDKFNKRYHYPWVFLNDEPFTDEFKQ